MRRVEFVCITGASRGIGRASAKQLAARGLHVVLLGRRSAHQDAVLAELGDSASIVEVELADSASVSAAGRAVLERFGAPLALINNAATITRAPLEELGESAFDEQLAVNLKAPWLLTRALLPSMRAAGRGRIVNVSSIAGTLGTARCTAYCASKWALNGFTKALAEELAGTPLMTCAILPGSVDTDMLVGSGFAPQMTAEDVARTVCFFALEAPRAHNGALVELFGT